MTDTNTPDTEVIDQGTTESEIEEPSVQAEDDQSSTQQAEQTDAQQGQSTESKSSFDPNSLPEELKGVYKQMQADYTKKTQAIAEERKQAEEWKVKAAKADELSKYEQFIPVFEEMLAPQNAQSTPQMAALEKQLKDAGYSEEAIDMMKIGAQFTLNQFNQERQSERQKADQDRMMQETTSKVEQAEKLDPRLTDENLFLDVDGQQIKFYEVVANFTKSDPNWIKDPVAATTRAIKIVDALRDQAKTEGKQELSTLASNKAKRFPSNNSSPQSTASNARPKTVMEAYELTKKQLGEN